MARRRYLDWLRGIAVLIMIQAHTLDAWTALSARSSIAYRNLIILGGFAAPLFLFLAGAGVALAVERRIANGASPRAAARSMLERGLQIFALAFLFRLQSFVLSPGSPLITLFRVDILNIMGLAMAMAGALYFCTAHRSGALTVFAGAAAVTAVSTPLVRASAWIDKLPAWIRWHLAPAGEHTTFTLLPWAGFLFAGVCWGIAALTGRGSQREARALTLSAAAGGALVGAGFYAASMPALFPSSSFWTSSPTFFAIRLGVMLMLAGVVFGASRLTHARGIELRPLEQLGRASLFVYWIHVELVYGYASWAWWRRLEVWQSVAGWAAFSALMYGAVVARNRLTNIRRNRRFSGVPPQSAPI